MASRNVNPIQGLGPTDKLQSNTLKRQPNPDWSKNDLLRLLSYFEGELQARDVTIAALRAEKAKNLLFQAKYGRFGLGDPFVALQRDSENMKDNSFDEPAIKSMYDNQLAQLENLIATQRKAQLKMREQLATGEKRYHKAIAELEDEKRKHAQDTAQGDDVTYMLEKERERLKQEVDFEKSQNKRLEKDLKKTLASLEEERAGSGRHKQVAIMLIKERKKLMERVFSEKTKTCQYEQILGEEKDKVVNMAEGLVQESKKSLKMEAAMEKQLSEFDMEREQLRSKLGREENRNKELHVIIDSLNSQIEGLQKTMQVVMERSAARDTVQSIEIKSSASPSKVGNPGPAHPGSTHPGPMHPGSTHPGSTHPGSTHPGSTHPGYVMSGSKPVLRGAKPGVVDSRTTSSSPERDYMGRAESGLRKPVVYGSPAVVSTSVERTDSRADQRLAPVGASSSSVSERASDGSPVHRVNIPPGSSATVVTSPGGKISLHVGGGGGGGGSPRKVTPLGRGVPPPIPPNKPVLNPGPPGPKPAPPPKVGVSSVAKDRVNAGGAEGEHSSRVTSPKSVQIPVNVVGGQGVSSGSRPPTRDSSPMRKTTQARGTSSTTCYTRSSSSTIRRLASVFERPRGASRSWPMSNQPKVVEQSKMMDRSKLRSKSLPREALQSTGVVSTSSAPALDFLGPEMADLHKLLATMTKGEDSAGDSPRIVSPIDVPFPSSICSVDVVRNSPVHKHSACNDLDALTSLILERDADVNLPMKDGTTPIHCATKAGHPDCLQFLLSKGANPNALRDDLLSPIHLAAANGHVSCVEQLLASGAVVNIGNQTNETPLHFAATRGHTQCCRLLLEHGARPFSANLTGLTPLHRAVKGSHAPCLRLLLQHSVKREGCPGAAANHDSLKQLVSLANNDGWTLGHMAACLEHEDCLRLLLEFIPLDLEVKDNLGRSAVIVASPRCRAFLTRFAGFINNNNSNNNNNNSMAVLVELHIPKTGAKCDASDSWHHYVMGTVDVTPLMSWSRLEDKCCHLLETYYTTLDTGLRTRKIHRLEPESPTDNSGYTLGLGDSSIKHFQISYHQWNPGQTSDQLPYEILCNNNASTLSITLNNSNDVSVSVAFDTLYPLATIKNYLRLLEQYQSVVFYGPTRSGKSYLIERLAQCIAHGERASGREPCILSLSLTSGYTNTAFVAYLKNTGCILPVEKTPSNKASPILLLQNIEMVNISQLFGCLLDPVQYRGKTYAFRLKDCSSSDNESYYMHEHFYLLATMNKSRSTGLDLCVQQRFRWIHFRLDSEPFRNHLARYLHRRLLHLHRGHIPAADHPVFKCAEWVVCVWQRLNDSLSKLGLPDLAFGPCLFFACPLEAGQEGILQWVKSLWNDLIAPQVRGAVKRGTGSETSSSDGQQKVANTALYVLMQRSIVLGCPLTGKDKELYMRGFSGSNELDIPLKIDKRRSFSHVNGKDAKQGADNPHRSKESRVEILVSSGGKVRHKTPRNVDDSVESGLCNSKRRSLSESNVDRASRLVQENPESDPLESQPKMPKLEIRSPILLSLSSSTTSSSSLDSTSCVSHGAGRVTSLWPVQRRHSSSPMATKKSHSSENISSSVFYSYASKRRSASPFSFSLTTPTSTLNSFKFLEVSTYRSPSSQFAEMSQEPLQFTASPPTHGGHVGSPVSVSMDSGVGQVFEADCSPVDKPSAKR